MMPVLCGEKCSQSQADRSKTSESENMGCENQQYVQTEWMSPTLRLPRHLPVSQKHSQEDRLTHKTWPCQYDILCAFHWSRFNNGVGRASCAVVNYHITSGSEASHHMHYGKCWRRQDAKCGLPGSFQASGWGFVTAQHHGDFTIHDEHIFRRCVMPCGVQNEDISHTYTSLSHYNVPAWTQHAEAATLNIFLLHVEAQNGKWNKAQ